MQRRVLVTKRCCKPRKINGTYHSLTTLFGIYPDLHGIGDIRVDHRDSEK
jgi:hypothetical protein